MPTKAGTVWRRVAQYLWRRGADAGMPADIERHLAALGPVIDTQATARIYAPLHAKEPYRGVRVARDIKYGPDQRNVLDVFAPQASPAIPLPVLLFMHGGGFFGGDRRSPDPDSPFYDNVMLLAVRNGMVGINATYRLVPQHVWPAGAEDVGAAVCWVRETIAAHGGDPARIVLMGHSAGAVHVATCLAHRHVHGSQGIGVCGAILVSGLYELVGRELFEGERLYFGEDAARYAERAALPGLAKADVSLMVVHAELDPPVFHDQAKRLATTLAQANRRSRAVLLAKHNHFSEIFALNTTDTSFGAEIAAFVRGLAPRKR